MIYTILILLNLVHGYTIAKFINTIDILYVIACRIVLF